MVIKFTQNELRKNKTFKEITDKYNGGQVAIVGGSRLFHGAPILALKAASRMVSMVYFSSPSEDEAVVTQIKAALGSFVWVSREEVEGYIEKSDAILIGPGLMRSHESQRDFVCDDEGLRTRDLTLSLVNKFPEKKWLLDGGSLQVLELADIPKGAVITPNHKEFEMLFGESLKKDIDERCRQIEKLAQDFRLIILTKDTVSIASDGQITYVIEGGNEGLIKGGVGDVIAGVTLGFMAKNEPLFSVAAATLIVKKAAEKLELKKGLMFNADDLAEIVPEVFWELTS